MTPGMDSLSVLRLTRIARKIQDARDNNNVTYRHRRLNRVPTTRNELMARGIGRVYIADLVALDSAAGVYSNGKMDFVSTDAPKIKIGRALTESQLDQFTSIFGGGAVQDDADLMDFIGPLANNALEGVALRMEALYVAMLRDRLDYDRLGFKASGSLWGMPSDLNVTPSIPITSTSATPITSTLAVMRRAKVKHGVEFNRLEASTTWFQYAVQTTEFQNYAKTFLPANITIGTNLSILDTNTMMSLFKRAIGGASDNNYTIDIQLNDDRYWYQNADGSDASARFQPINEVYLTDSRNDGRNSAADIGTIPVIESMLMGLNPSAVIGAGSTGLRAPQRGPISYMTYPPDLNPPQVTYWAADVAFPRKHIPAYSAKFNWGSFSDEIEISEPVF